MDWEFQDFFRIAYPKVVASLQQMGFGREEAADSAAEAMTQLLLRTRTVDRPLAWVTKVAFHDAARNAHRARIGLQKTIFAAHGEPSSFVEEPGLDEVVLNLLDKLTPAARHVIVLYYQGYETKEIADVLGTQESTVRSHRRHARLKLKELIAKMRAESDNELDESLSVLQLPIVKVAAASH